MKMLTAKQVVKRLDKIKNKIKSAQDELDNLQKNICPHHHLTYEPRGDSGNWDGREDYWYEWRCYDCERRWQTDQTIEEERKYPHAKKIYHYGGMLRRDYEQAYRAKMRGESIV
jgi:hypothetical protein